MAKNPYNDPGGGNPYVSFGMDYYNREVKKRWDKKREDDEMDATRRRMQQEAPPEDKRSFFDKAKDLAGGVVEGVRKPYDQLAGGLSEVLADVTGVTDEEEFQRQRAEDNAHEGLILAAKKIADPNTPPEQKKRWQKVLDLNNKQLREVTEEQTKLTQERSDRADPRKGAAAVASIGTDILSGGVYGAAAKGAKTARLGRDVSSTVGRGRRVATGAATGAGFGAAGDAAYQGVEDDGFDVEELLQNAGLGAVLGGLGGGIGKTRTPETRTDRLLSENASIPEERRLAERNPITDESRLIGTGSERVQRRLDEIDSRLNEIRTGRASGTKYTPEDKTMANLGTDSELLGDTQFNKNLREGQVSVAKGTTREKANQVAQPSGQEVRALVQERQQLLRDTEKQTLRDLPDDVPATQAAQQDPVVHKAIQNDLGDIDEIISKGDNNYSPGIVAALNTPERVFHKAGLGDLFDRVRTSYDAHVRTRNAGRRQISDWADRIGRSKESSERVFRYLDGEDIQLNANELDVANEARDTLQQLADTLNLPAEQRITDYIPHLFDTKAKRIDPELQRLMQRRAGTNVDSPFLKTRTGAPDYKRDFLEAMDVYVDKASRMQNLSKPLEELQTAKPKVTQQMAEYINEQMNILKNVPDTNITEKVETSLSKIGIREGDLSKGSGIARSMIYRATLGANVGSAVRNLTQGVNTFSQLGTKWTGYGYAQAARTVYGHGLDELIDTGVLDDTFYKAVRGAKNPKLNKGVEVADNVLWSMFQTAEQINRASAYFGAKGRALAKGASEAEARKAGSTMARKTQFKFSPIDTPHTFRGPVAKNLTQFMSFNVKQVEFLKDLLAGSEGMFKKADNGRYTLSPSGAWRVARFVGGTYASLASIGTLIGMDPEDFIPFWNDVSEGGLPQSPLTQLALGGKNKVGIKNILTGKGAYGEDESRLGIAKDFGENLLGLTIPGGTQAKKTIEGLGAVEQGGSYSDAGRLRYTVKGGPEETARAGVFGQYALPEGQEYFDRGGEALSDKQTSIVKEVPPSEQDAYYNFFTDLQDVTSKKDAVGKQVREAVKNKQFEKARRLSLKHNDQVESAVDKLNTRVDEVPDDILDYINNGYLVNYEYYRKRND